MKYVALQDMCCELVKKGKIYTLKPTERYGVNILSIWNSKDTYVCQVLPKDLNTYFKPINLSVVKKNSLE